MFKYSKHQLKTSSKERGFVTLEIIVSILIALGFVAVAMQSLVYAMAMKVQAQEKQKANLLIQEDIERVNQLGAAITEDHANKCNPIATTAPVKTAYQNGYANKLWEDLQIDTPDASDNLEEKVLRKVKSDGTEDTVGKILKLRRVHVSNTSSDAPHRTLKVGYQVWFWDDDDDRFEDKNGVIFSDANSAGPIAETYVEVIPRVALECP